MGTRAILNFAHQCALKCPWCYVPFGGAAADLSTVAAVIDRLAQLGFCTVTIGGGDPFQYSFIRSAIYLAKQCGLTVHVDTHGKSMRPTEENQRLLETAVDLLGLPLDGPVRAVHDAMRNAPGHYDLVQKRLSWLAGTSAQLKINTLISKQNVESLAAIGDVIATLRPARWSLYQYWPLGPGAQVRDAHELDSGVFLSEAGRVVELLKEHSTVVEVCPKTARRRTYPIVHHDGVILVHDPLDESAFEVIGSVFDKDALTKIASLSGADRPDAAARYL